MHSSLIRLVRSLRSATVVALGLAGLSATAGTLDVASYSTVLGSATSTLYKDSIYDGAVTVASPLVTYTGGTGKLTDGVTTGGNPWLGWYGESGWPATLDHPTIVFDFGTTAAITDVGFYAWRFQQNLIYLPTAMHVDYSNDGVSFSGVQNFTISAGAIPDGTTGWLNFSLGGNGRYARVVLDNVGRDTFISEVTFKGSTVPDAAPTSLCLALAFVGFATVRRFRRA